LRSLATWRPREPLAADVLTFDTNGDGVPDITIPDSDGDGRFEWPAGTTKLPGTLHFSAGNNIEFSGYTTIKADAITIDQGATLSAGLNLHQIVFIATHGDTAPRFTLHEVGFCSTAGRRGRGFRGARRTRTERGRRPRRFSRLRYLGSRC